MNLGNIGQSKWLHLREEIKWLPGKAPGQRHLVLCVVIAATARKQHTRDPEEITAHSQLMQYFRS